MKAIEKRAAAEKLRTSAKEIRQDAQYTDSAQARMQQENIARRHEVEAALHEAQANAIDAQTLAEVRKLLKQFKARYIGTITLPAAGADLAEIVPHEVTHAAIERLKRVDIADDEPLAYLIGQLTQSIRRRLAERGIKS